MWDLVLGSDKDISTLFNKSQTGVSSRDAKQYVKTQHNLVRNFTTFGEQHTTITSISPFIVTSNISKLYQRLGTVIQKSDKNKKSDRRSDKKNNSASMDSIDQFIVHHWRSTLPPLESRYYKPYHIIQFLTNHGKRPVYFCGELVTKRMVIDSLIQNNVVPIHKTTLYRISTLFNCSCMSTTDTWTELTKPGCKAYLSFQGFDYIVSHIRLATAGGVSMPLGKIRIIIKVRIFF